jgi:hypothetical protein
MADDSMSLLETLRKVSAGGEVDVLREGVRLLAQAIPQDDDHLQGSICPPGGHDRADHPWMRRRKGARRESRSASLRPCATGYGSGPRPRAET